MKKIKLITIYLGTLFALYFPSFVKAQNLVEGEKMQKLSTEFSNTAGFSGATIGGVVATILKTALSILALIFLVLTVMAGFQWMNAGGNEEVVKKAQSSFKNAIIGLVIVLAAYTITYFVFNNLPFSMSGSGATAVPF